MGPETAVGPSGRIALPTLAVLAGSGAALIATLLARIVMARALTPAELGVVLLAIAVVSGAGGAASLGLAAAGGRRVAELRALGRVGEARASARSALAVAGAGGAAAAAALLVTAAVLAGRPGTRTLGGILAVLAPAALALAPGLAMVGVARGSGDVLGRPLIRDAGGGLVRLAAISLAVLAGGGARAIALGFLAGSLVGETAFIAYGALRGWLRPEGEGRRDPGLGRGLRPYAVMEGLNQLTVWADVLVLGALATPQAVGYYGVARGVARALDLVHAAGAYHFLPSATAAVAGGSRDGLLRLYTRMRMLAFALLWPLLALCLAVPAAAVVALFGPAYLQAAPLLRLLAAALAVQVLFGYKDLALIAMGGARLTATINALAFGAGALAMLALVPRLGAAGAALGVLVMTGTRGIALARALFTKVGVRPWAEDVPRSVAGAVLVAAVAFAAAALAHGGATVAAVTVLAAAVAGSIGVFGSLYRRRR